MHFLSMKILAPACALCATAACSQPASDPAPANGADAVAAPAPSEAVASKTVAINAKAFGAKMPPMVQPLVKIPLALAQVNDSSNDDLNTDDSTYASCMYSSGAKRVTLIMRAASDMLERDKRNGLTPVSGYGDQAFYSGEKGGGLHWVDAVRGSDSCEALLGVETGDLVNGDFAGTGGQICLAAFAAR